MTIRQFETNARQFVRQTLHETMGREPTKAMVDRTTAKLVDNFRPILPANQQQNAKGK